MKYKIWVEIEELDGSGEPTGSQICLPDTLAELDDAACATSFVKKLLLEHNPNELATSDCRDAVIPDDERREGNQNSAALENHRLVSSLQPVQDLYVAAKLLLAAQGNWLVSMLRLKRAVTAIEAAAADSSRLNEVRDLARELYTDTSNDIEIDDQSFTYSSGEGGYWVGAWLFVPDELVACRVDAAAEAVTD